MAYETGKMPCRVVVEKKEDGDEYVFVFKDEYTAEEYSDSFPSQYFRWICWDGYYNAFWTKVTMRH